MNSMNRGMICRTVAGIALAFSLGSYGSMMILAPVWISRFPVGPLLREVLQSTFEVLGWSGCLWLVLACFFLLLSSRMLGHILKRGSVPVLGLLGPGAAFAGTWVAGIVPLTAALARGGNGLETWFFLSHALSVVMVIAVMALEIWGMTALIAWP